MTRLPRSQAAEAVIIDRHLDYLLDCGDQLKRARELTSWWQLLRRRQLTRDFLHVAWQIQLIEQGCYRVTPDGGILIYPVGALVD